MDVLNAFQDEGGGPPAADTGEDLRLIDTEDLMWADTVHYRDRPVIAAECDGELITGLDGTVYVDTRMWHSSVNFGYRNRAISKAVRDQLDRLPQVCGDHLYEEKLLLAREIADSIAARFGARGRVSFNVSGTLAIEDALKIARHATGKQLVAAFMGGYHGRSLAVSGISSSQRYRAPYGTFPDRAVLFPYADCGSCFYDMSPDSCGTYCAGQVTKTLSNEFYGLMSEHGTDLATLLIEPCQGRGYAVPAPGFLPRVVSEFQRHGVVVVDDEIQAGMYRTGRMFAAEGLGVTPDIIVLGKSLTNGMFPLSAVWARSDLVDPATFGPGHTHSTFANHPLGTTAALATIRYANARDYEARVPAAGEYYLDGLRRLREAHSCVGEVSGRGLMMRMMLRDRAGQPWRNGAHLAAQLAQDTDGYHRGERLRMMLNPGGYAGDVLKLAPWLDISNEGIDRHIALLDGVLDRLELQARRS